MRIIYKTLIGLSCALSFLVSEKAKAQSPSSFGNSSNLGTAASTIGSGYILNQQGKVLTAAHVVEGCTNLIAITQNGQRATIRIDRIDLMNDLAMGTILVRMKPMPNISLRSRFNDGENLFAAGFSGQTHSLNLMNGKANSQNADTLTIAAPVYPGASGGPVFDRAGNLVGVIYARSQGLGYASTGDALKRFLAANSITPDPPKTQFAADMQLMRVVKIGCNLP